MKEEDYSGLGEDWGRLIRDLEEISGYYEQGNRILSFGSDVELRMTLLKKGLPEKGVFLDVGCGPGNMTALARLLRPEMEGVLMDPIPKMLSRAMSERGEEGLYYICGVYENLPVREQAFSACLAGFTLRDARNRLRAYSEIRKGLKCGGTLMVVDLAKPDSWLKRLLVTTYWRVIAPLRLRLLLGRKGRPYADIYLTYRHLPPNAILLGQIQETVGKVWAEKRMLDGVLLVVASRE
jgi:demethylmenaquinone methyltransferase/2-methoxy-6-polyprenyl-1,4-benzoquinol methylase